MTSSQEGFIIELNNKTITLGILVFLFGTFGGNLLIQYLDETSEANQVAQGMINKYRPDFTLPDLEGTLHDVSEWDGKVLAVNFWATWCTPCRREIPAFMALQEQYGGQGLQIVGIAIDEKSDVSDYVDTLGINYPVLIGEQQAIDAAKDYGDRFGALPYTAIVDRRGTIVFVKRGELSRERAEEAIKSLL